MYLLDIAILAYVLIFSRIWTAIQETIPTSYAISARLFSIAVVATIAFAIWRFGSVWTGLSMLNGEFVSVQPRSQIAGIVSAGLDGAKLAFRRGVHEPDAAHSGQTNPASLLPQILRHPTSDCSSRFALAFPFRPSLAT